MRGLRAFGVFAALAFVLVSVTADAKPRARKKSKPKEPSIAYYLAEYGTVKAVSREAAVAMCQAKRIEERKNHPELAGYTQKACKDSVVVVRGPFDRKAKRTSDDPYDDLTVFVYKGSDGVWYDKNGESPCFVSGTPVATPDGERAIESLREGDVVWSWDFETGTGGGGVVEKTTRRVAPRVETLALAGGHTVTATPNHPFFSVCTRTWIALGSLAADDSVMVLKDGALAARALRGEPVATSSSGGDAFTVYDLTVAPHRNYFAAGVLVHNY
jgi:hypothetical protein